MVIKVREAEFISVWNAAGGSPSAVAKLTGLSHRQIYQRRRDLGARGVYLKTIATTPTAQAASNKHGYGVTAHAYTPLVKETLKDCQLVVFSDAHYWPGEPSLAHQALCKLVKREQPKAIYANGDMFDGARISRHDVLGWQKLPTVAEELDACRSRLDEIKRASPRSRTRATVGNHDSRMDRRLATEIPDFADIHGMSLADHLKDWPLSYAILVNEDTDPVLVVHNVCGGIHATWNNTAKAGCHVVTGHLHDQNERPRKQLLKEIVGIDTGCLADHDGPQFSYVMSRPSNVRSGFALLTFDSQGRLLPPEFCRVQVFGGYRRAVFRGEVLAEKRERKVA